MLLKPKNPFDTSVVDLNPLDTVSMFCNKRISIVSSLLRATEELHIPPA